MKSAKLKIAPLRITLMFIGIYLFLQILFMSTLDFLDITVWPPQVDNLFLFYIYTPALLAISVAFYIVSLTKTFYYVDKKKITHHKMNKIFEYYFSDMTYIDEKWSKKHRTLLFYDKAGRRKYLTFDRDGIIFDTALENAHPLSRDDFQIRFPNTRL
ncbi:MAG: hypothetical protein EOM77_02735 [Bacteroidia bacterium]|nr:hypothetical protein [Bacteroidia bacterium]